MASHIIVTPKPGYQTTEFWLTLLVSVYSALIAAVPPPFNVVVPGVAVGLYTIGRALAKGGLLRGDLGRYFDRAEGGK